MDLPDASRARPGVSGHLPAERPDHLLDAMPPDLLARVFVVGNGELLWPAAIAARGARWLSGQGRAILGGEVYVAMPPAWGVLCAEWATTPRLAPDEEWDDFVARGLQEAEQQVDSAIRRLGSERLHLFFASLGRHDDGSPRIVL